MSLLKVLA